MSNKKIEVMINDVLSGDAQKNALEFVAYLRRYEMSFEDNEFCWDIKYKDNIVCHIKIGSFNNEPGHWIVWSADNFNNECADGLADEHIKDFAWAHVCFCGNCNEECVQGRNATIFGKAFEKVCTSAFLMFPDPDTEVLTNVRVLLNISITVIDNLD